MTTPVAANEQRAYDPEIEAIADYVLKYEIQPTDAWDTARYCLMDSLGCALQALQYPECNKLLGPRLEGTWVPLGARVPGTQFRLDPVKAAWDMGCLIRWLDFNDTWLAAEWGHPSDNIGAILAVADHVSQQRTANGEQPLKMKTVLEAMIKAHEIQGVLALENSFNRAGLDHVILVKVASTAVVTWLMGGNREQIMAAISQAWADSAPLRVYRHAPNTGSRKSWAAGDACARAVQLADMTMRGEMGIPSVLSTPQWGFYDVLFSHNSEDLSLKPEHERALRLPRSYGSYVMENVLFKITYPAEFHAQTACEAAAQLHALVKPRLAQIKEIRIRTQQPAMRIISKTGNLSNPADRDHCLQYIVAVTLLLGTLKAEHYEDGFHQTHPDIDRLRALMVVSEDEGFSRDYLDPAKRSIANGVEVIFTDDSSTGEVVVEYPLGHRLRRPEGMPMLENKFMNHLQSRYPKARAKALFKSCKNSAGFSTMPVNQFMGLWSI